jgi:hypothetical protein
MIFKDYNIVLDAYRIISTSSSSMSFVKGDTRTCRLIFNVLKNSRPENLKDTEIWLIFKKSDNTLVTQNISNGLSMDESGVGKIKCVLATQTLAYAGIVQGVMIINYADGSKLTLPEFQFEVLEDMDIEDAIVSTNEFTILQGKIVEATNATQAANQAALDVNTTIEEEREVTTQAKQLINTYQNYNPLVVESNVFILDLSSAFNFSLETLDTVAKSITIVNVPETEKIIISLSLKIKYTNASAITFPANVKWQNGAIPSFTAGKEYILILMSYDNGVTWLTNSTGAW